MGEHEQVIRAIPHRFAAAWNVHDAAALAAPFHADADFTNVFGMRASGRDAIRDFHAPIFESMFRDSRLEIDDVHVRVLRPDIATADVRWTMTGAMSPTGEPWPRRHGLMTLVCSQEAGEWGIAVMHNMDLPDASLAEAQEALAEGV